VFVFVLLADWMLCYELESTVPGSMLLLNCFHQIGSFK